MTPLEVGPLFYTFDRKFTKILTARKVFDLSNGHQRILKKLKFFLFLAQSKVRIMSGNITAEIVIKFRFQAESILKIG